MEERRRLAYLMTETWMTMIFRHGFFHGDPHPANIFVLGDGDQIGLVDFGQVGKLTDEDMSKLTRLFIDAANEQIEQLPRRLAELGVRYPKEREEEFVAELREMYYRYYGVSLAEIDPLQVIREAFQLIYRLNLRLPTRFVHARQGDRDAGLRRRSSSIPDFNVFEVAKPYARSLMLERYTPQRMLTRARKEGIELARIARDLPYQLHDVARAGARRPDRGRLRAQGPRRVHAQARRRVQPARDRARRRRRPDRLEPDRDLLDDGPQIAGVNFLSFVGFVLSGLLGLWLLWGVLRSGAAVDDVSSSATFPRERTSGGAREAAVASFPCRRRCSSPSPSRERGSSWSGTWRATASRCSARTRDVEALELVERERPDLVLVGGLPDAPRSRSADCCARASRAGPGTATCR